MTKQENLEIYRTLIEHNLADAYRQDHNSDPQWYKSFAPS